MEDGGAGEVKRWACQSDKDTLEQNALNARTPARGMLPAAM